MPKLEDLATGSRWRRPHGLDVLAPLTLLVLLIAFLPALLAVREALAGRWHAYFLLVPVVVVVGWRGVLVGVLLSQHGVRIRNFWHTRTVGWSDLAAATAAPAGPWDADTLWILTSAGRSIRTPLRRVPLRSWTSRRPHWRGGLRVKVMTNYHFDALLRLLRARSTGHQPVHAPNWPPTPRLERLLDGA